MLVAALVGANESFGPPVGGTQKLTWTLFDDSPCGVTQTLCATYRAVDDGKPPPLETACSARARYRAVSSPPPPYRSSHSTIIRIP
jgi:hypothetical protein